jgi:hypothetical protein
LVSSIGKGILIGLYSRNTGRYGER